MNAKPNADEIVKALRACGEEKCSDCPLREPDYGGISCTDIAADLIEHLTGELAIATASNKRLAENYSAYSGSALERADELIELLEEQLAASQRRERAAVEAIRKSLRVEKQQRPHLTRCLQCAKRIVDEKQRKYKYGCESLCPNALKVIVGCGFDVYESLIPFAEDWSGPEAGKGEAE